MNKLCEFALDKSIGFSVNVICTKTNEFCGMIRYCSIEQRPVMTSSFYKNGCKIKQKYGETMARKSKKIESTDVKNDIIEENFESGTNFVIGKVNFTKNGKTSIQYPLNGHYYNIKVNGTYSGSVRIDYNGTLTENNIISIIQT